VKRIEPGNFKDAVVIITGGASGIGKALAEELSGRGAEISLEERNAVLATNLTGMFLCCKAVVPIMRVQKAGAPLDSDFAADLS
jgi:NAD(P)-dependent dehydrogenase (short-subunit alcohol dehydrogenase family)